MSINKPLHMQILIILFLFLNLLDYITTKFGLSYGASELNYLANFFIQYELLGLYKLTLTVVAIAVFKYIELRRSKKRAMFYLVAANIIFLGVVVWNAYVIKIMSELV